jgi:hypothetical protein
MEVGITKECDSDLKYHLPLPLPLPLSKSVSFSDSIAVYDSSDWSRKRQEINMKKSWFASAKSSAKRMFKLS